MRADSLCRKYYAPSRLRIHSRMYTVAVVSRTWPQAGIALRSLWQPAFAMGKKKKQESPRDCALESPRTPTFQVVYDEPFPAAGCAVLHWESLRQIGAGIGFGQSQTTSQLPTSELRQPEFFLY